MPYPVVEPRPAFLAPVPMTHSSSSDTHPPIDARLESRIQEPFGEVTHSNTNALLPPNDELPEIVMEEPLDHASSAHAARGAASHAATSSAAVASGSTLLVDASAAPAKLADLVPENTSAAVVSAAPASPAQNDFPWLLPPHADGQPPPSPGPPSSLPCRTECPTHAIYCSRCGLQVQPPTEPSCFYCHSPLPLGARFCIQCGISCSQNGTVEL